jgi:hypothetical protein
MILDKTEDKTETMTAGAADSPTARDERVQDRPNRAKPDRIGMDTENKAAVNRRDRGNRSADCHTAPGRSAD